MLTGRHGLVADKLGIPPSPQHYFMWAIDNQTPFQVARSFARDRDGAEWWLGVIKGTFDVRADSSLAIAREQEPVLRAPVYFGMPGQSSLRYDADMVLTKPTTDVLLHGHAYTPRRQPGTEVTVELSLDSISKKLWIVGDRAWNGDWLSTELGEPVPFSKMPLVYERAFGGSDAKQGIGDNRNPIGKGLFASRSSLAGMSAPNIEYLAGSGSRPTKAARPAGFGPIAPNWSPRLELAGTYDDSWMVQRKPLVPTDFDYRFFQCAPEDQQTPKYLTGGEHVELVNLTPEGRLNFRLPRVALGCATSFFRASRRVFHRPNLHTVILEPDLRRVIMVWHTSFPCHYTLYDIKSTQFFLKLRTGNGPSDGSGRQDRENTPHEAPNEPGSYGTFT